MPLRFSKTRCFIYATLTQEVFQFFKVHVDVNIVVVFLLKSNVDVTGITQLQSSGVPDQEKSVQGCNLQSINSSFNTVIGNPYSLVDSEHALKASTPLNKLLEQPSSDEEISFDPEEDLDFSVRYSFYQYYIVQGFMNCIVL